MARARNARCALFVRAVRACYGRSAQHQSTRYYRMSLRSDFCKLDLHDVCLHMRCFSKFQKLFVLFCSVQVL